MILKFRSVDVWANLISLITSYKLLSSCIRAIAFFMDNCSPSVVVILTIAITIITIVDT